MRTTRPRMFPIAAAAVLLLLTAMAAGAPWAAAAGPASAQCGAGRLCLWERPGFEGERRIHELADTDIESCVPVSLKRGAASFVNRTGRPVTVYQSAECDTTGDFSTYPSGSWVPEAPYTVRAFTIWER